MISFVAKQWGTSMVPLVWNAEALLSDSSATVPLRLSAPDLPAPPSHLVFLLPSD